MSRSCLDTEDRSRFIGSLFGIVEDSFICFLATLRPPNQSCTDGLTDRSVTSLGYSNGLTFVVFF